jgi:hypothetical protein
MQLRLYLEVPLLETTTYTLTYYNTFDSVAYAYIHTRAFACTYTLSQKTISSSLSVLRHPHYQKWETPCLPPSAHYIEGQLPWILYRQCLTSLAHCLQAVTRMDIT